MKSDTIAAIATPPGTGGVAIIRISGNDAHSVLKRVFSYQGKYEHARMVYGSVLADGKPVDTGLAVLFDAPHSYTGENTAEIHCHGSVVGAGMVLQTVLRNGARAARPGEFTQRAFLNGKMDLTQAEAVCDYIAAVCAAGAKASLRQASGELRRKIAAMQDTLTDLLAEIEAGVEYPEEDLETEIAGRALPVLEDLTKETAVLADTFECGSLIKEGMPVVIVGKPNVGKSSLLNALAGLDRAIVADVAGTTRDTIEQTIILEGIAIKLTDTAGIRSARDKIEEEGVKRSKTAINECKLVIFVLDLTQKISMEDHFIYQQLKDAAVDVLVVLNKLDASQRRSEQEFLHDFGQGEIISVSAKTGEGVETLKQEIARRAHGNETAEETLMITNQRHRDLLEETKRHLVDAVLALQNGLDLDCVTIDLNAAWKALGEITGNTVSEEIIDRIFSKFCLGK